MRAAKPLARFRLGMRVRVTDTESPLVARKGTVCRMRRADDAAWIAMDDDLPEHLASFAVGDDRRNNIILWPEQCEAVS